MASRNPEIREIEHLLQVAKTAKVIIAHNSIYNSISTN